MLTKKSRALYKIHTVNPLEKKNCLQLRKMTKKRNKKTKRKVIKEAMRMKKKMKKTTMLRKRKQNQLLSKKTKAIEFLRIKIK